MPKNYVTRVTGATIVPQGKPLTSKEATFISAIGRAVGGEFVQVEQPDKGKLHIDRHQWPELRREINHMFELIEKHGR